jgi:aspartate/methionine/tyrosine aminotransferase
MGARADRLADPRVLRLENLDTDLRPPSGVVDVTRNAADRDDANSYLPFIGSDELRRAATEHVTRSSGVTYDWNASAVITAGGLNGVLNTLLAILEPGDEVVLADPIYVGLINRVRLAGGVPVFLDMDVRDGRWALDRDSIRRALSPRTRAFLMMSPAMPSGAVFDREDWAAVCEACVEADAWMVYDAAMERILFDGLEVIHPAAFPGMAARTITVGAVSKEQRMIGWRVGWVVAPPGIIDDIGLVGISNVVCPVGVAQEAAAAALRAPASDQFAVNRVWEARRDVVLRTLEGYPVIRPQGGWSLLVDVSRMAMTGDQASNRLMESGHVAATPMVGWGSERSRGLLRLVFSNEPEDRLAGLRERFETALGPAPSD